MARSKQSRRLGRSNKVGEPPPPPYAHSPAIARVFQSGNSQAVRLPKQFRLRSKQVQVFRRGFPLLVAGVGLVLLGIALEFAQGAFTATRMADLADAMANAAGVALGLLTALTPWRDALLERFR